MRSTLLRLVLPLAALAFAAGCGPGYKRNPVPFDLAHKAHVPGLEGVRIIGPERVMIGGADRMAELQRQARTSDHFDRPITFLSISGGGAQGAYGAGLLNGWTERGDRPEFTYVTGISTGALTAPFAFLGSDYDEVLRTVYTSVSTKDISRKRGLLATLTGDAASTPDGLERIIAEHVDADLVNAIAREHRRGRRLYIGTTNLDLMTPVYWNIGRIAISGDPASVDLIRSILLASASIPGAFPPVYIDVVANGAMYDEMHVDGGAGAQVFAYPGLLDLNDELGNIGISTEGARLFVIRNSLLTPVYEQVEPRLFPIMSRAISSLIRTQGIGDIYQIYLIAERDGVDFHVTFIGSEFKGRPSEPFDPEYMTSLFEYGRQRMLRGDVWSDEPPAYDED